jgi:hypothetical protein
LNEPGAHSNEIKNIHIYIQNEERNDGIQEFASSESEMMYWSFGYILILLPK